MTIRDILVYADSAPATRARLEIAAALAARHQAQLTGVFLRSAFMKSFWAAEAAVLAAAIDIAAVIREQEAAVTKAEDAARMEFEGLARDAGVSSDWLSLDGDTDTRLIAAARRFDLTVMPIRARPMLSENEVSASEIAMASGGPVLAVPDGSHGPMVGRRVMVAWKNSRESARALRDAWPLLAAAQEVHVVVASQDGDYGPDGELQDHFHRHGLKPNIIVAADDDLIASAVLRREAIRLKADLIVMGVFGRPRLGQMLFGGVSADLLANPPAALLLSH
jgi:nucleotide-binding universal stress UspA family protein